MDFGAGEAIFNAWCESEAVVGGASVALLRALVGDPARFEMMDEILRALQVTLSPAEHPSFGLEPHARRGRAEYLNWRRD